MHNISCLVYSASVMKQRGKGKHFGWQLNEEFNDRCLEEMSECLG